MFCLETFILDYWEKTRTENQQLFDGIIDVALIDWVERLNLCLTKIICVYVSEICTCLLRRFTTLLKNTCV